jgi:predicted metal-binding membrane protein
MGAEHGTAPARGMWAGNPAAEASKAAAPGATVRVPSVLSCGFTLLWVKAMLRARGFLATIGWIRRRVERVPSTSAVDPQVVGAVEHAVAMAAAFYPGRAKCLEQSLALYYLLRRKGVSAQYCQGVRQYPFRAHAWIEYHGEVINDVPEHARFFERLPGQLL